MAKISREISIVLVYIGGANCILPVLMAKLLRKKVVVAAIGRGSQAQGEKSSSLLNRAFCSILGMLERANFCLSDRILVESEGVVDSLGVGRYRQKLVLGGRYIDAELFKARRELRERETLVGYVGRLDEAKGVMNFLRAIPLVLQSRQDVKFVIGGGGALQATIGQQVESNGLRQYVELPGWIPHDELPSLMSRLMMLVLPSYSEGLPVTVLEAMACGTPVLATPVGGVPDVIRDRETGFLIPDNSPDGIARSILTVLNFPNMEQVARSARAIIEKEFTFESAVERYRGILDSLFSARGR